ALSLTCRHRRDGTKALLAEPDEPQRVVRPLHCRAPRQQVLLGEVPDELGGGQLRGEVVVLGGVPDARADRDPGRGRILPEHGQLARVTGAQAEHERDEGRLPRAVRAEEPRDPGPDLHVDAREGGRAAVSLDDASCADHGLTGCSIEARPSHAARSSSSARTAFVVARVNFTSSWIAATRSTDSLRSAAASSSPRSRSWWRIGRAK